jgi:hypothetical protein
MHGTQFQMTFRIQVICLWLLLHPQLSLYSTIWSMPFRFLVFQLYNKHTFATCSTASSQTLKCLLMHHQSAHWTLALNNHCKVFVLHCHDFRFRFSHRS